MQVGPELPTSQMAQHDHEIDAAEVAGHEHDVSSSQVATNGFSDGTGEAAQISQQAATDDFSDGQSHPMASQTSPHRGQ